MSFLVFTDDELALLRFTCDLFFVEESPLYYLDAEPIEPADYEETYKGLVEKRVIDPAGFRITDEALNRLAPITECDGRVVHIARSAEGTTERDFYLLDEIAVPYLPVAGGGHALGADLDHDELLDHLARRLEPRRAAGDRLDLSLTPVEYLALCRLTADDEGQAGALSRDEARTRLGAPPPPSALEGASPSRLSVLAHRRGTPWPASGPGLVGIDAWDAALEGLLQREVLRLADDRLTLRPGLVDAIAALARAERHTFVRYDFADDEWLMRETTFLPADGTLFFVGAEPGASGELRLAELDGEALKAALQTAIGRLPVAAESRPRRPFRAVLFGSEEEGEADTEIGLPTVTLSDPSSR